MKIEIIEPHGFCAGVAAALKKADALAALCAGDPAQRVYCLHEPVHNELVTAGLTARGLRIADSIDEIPDSATVLFSAHGVPPSIRNAARARRLNVIDATCPFVARVHSAARAYAAHGLPVVIIGDSRHIETQGIAGEVEHPRIVKCQSDIAKLVDPKSPSHIPSGSAIGIVSQTTMNSDLVAELVAELQRHFRADPTAAVCNASKVRQDAVRAFQGDAVLVLGSANSSNTRKLCETARCRAFRAATLDEVKSIDFSGVSTLGVTSGASTPESFFNEVIALLRG